MVSQDRLADGAAALTEGRWDDARTAFVQALAEEQTAEGAFGLAEALWWLGDSFGCVQRAEEAYALARRCGDVDNAAQAAIWLAIVSKSNLGNAAAANGWVRRAERLLGPLEPGSLQGWLLVARAYRLADLEVAERLTQQALELALAVSDADLELVALAQLGHIRVGNGDVTSGFALLDEAMAAALAGERTTLDTVVYACCDMLNACDLAADIERAAQWCAAADAFVARYGCPFLYSECRVNYGSVLAATGRWEDADRELGAALRMTARACPALHTKALTCLARLRIGQGRLEEAAQLLSLAEQGLGAEHEAALTSAALMLARGDASAARRSLDQWVGMLGDHRLYLAVALGLLVDACVVTGDLVAADRAAHRLAALARSAGSARVAATAMHALGVVAMARADEDEAVRHLAEAQSAWSRLGLPFELARVRLDLGRAAAPSRPEVAVDAARRALFAFEALGARLEADRAAEFLRSLGVIARTGDKGVGVLTTREQEVLGLLGVGLSNPEIAARLHVSRKTASHHVSSVLAKLGLRNRAEAAVYAARLETSES